LLLQSIRKTTKLYLFLFLFLFLTNFAVIGKCDGYKEKLVNTIQQIPFSTDGYTYLGNVWYKDVNFTYTVKCSDVFNSTHYFSSDYVDEIYLICSRGSYQFEFDMVIYCWSYNSTYSGWLQITNVPNQTWSAFNYSLAIWFNTYYHRTLLQMGVVKSVDINTFTMFLKIRIAFTNSYATGPSYVSLVLGTQFHVWGMAIPFLSGDVVTSVVNISVYAIMYFTIPIIFAKVFGKKGAGVGFLLMSFIMYIISEIIFVSIIGIVMGLIILLRREN